MLHDRWNDELLPCLVDLSKKTGNEPEEGMSPNGKSNVSESTNIHGFTSFKLNIEQAVLLGSVNERLKSIILFANVSIYSVVLKT